jgi:hypothetical protein
MKLKVAIPVLAIVAAFGAMTVRADDNDAAHVRLAAAQKVLDDLRDNATADDYRTIQVRGKDGHVTTRRVPTEEFAARIERAEKERDAAQAAVNNPQRSLY